MRTRAVFMLPPCLTAAQRVGVLSVRTTPGIPAHLLLAVMSHDNRRPSHEILFVRSLIPLQPLQRVL